MFLTQLVFVCLFSDIDYQSYDGNHKFFKKIHLILLYCSAFFS